jgi:hypothetical protein
MAMPTDSSLAQAAWSRSASSRVRRLQESPQSLRRQRRRPARMLTAPQDWHSRIAFGDV